MLCPVREFICHHTFNLSKSVGYHSKVGVLRPWCSKGRPWPKRKTLVTEGKTLVTNGKNLVTEWKTWVTKKEDHGEQIKMIEPSGAKPPAARRA